MNNPPGKIAVARFSIGDLVHHNKFDYRGVIADIDAQFSLTDEWYDSVARSRPPKDQPWYHVLVDGGNNTTYVAERHLEPDGSGEPVTHPLTKRLFSRFVDGRYRRATRNN